MKKMRGLDHFCFSSLYVPIDNKLKGLVKIYILNEVKFLEMVVEIHQILFDINDSNLIKTIMKSITDQCETNPTNNDNIFNSISTKILGVKKINYYELENLVEKFKFLNQYNKDDLNQLIQLPSELFGFSAKIPLRHVYRIKRYTESFLFNYTVLSDILKYVDMHIGEKEHPPIDQNVLLPGLDQSGSDRNNVIKKDQNSKENESSLEVQKNEKSRIDQILDFVAICPQLFNYCLYQIFNFFPILKLTSVEVSDNKILFYCPEIFPYSTHFNRSYILGLIESIEKIEIGKINLLIKNLIKMIFNDEKKITSCESHICILILFFFALRHLIETHKNWIENHIDLIFSELELQLKMLNKYITQISGIQVNFLKKEPNQDDLDESISEIEQVSKKYIHLKNLDQFEFANIVYNELKQLEPKSKNPLKITTRNILNIEKYLKNQETPCDFIQNSFANRMNLTLLKYQPSQKNPKIITELLEIFLNYVENPVSLVAVKNGNHSIPNNILNLFEALKNFLNDENFHKSDINTLDYVLRLQQILPDDIPFTNVLFLVYQLIIPYMYYFYDVCIFDDCFLTII